MFCISSEGKNIKFNEERARIYSKYLNDIAKKDPELAEPIKLDLTFPECSMFKKLIKYGHMPSCFITHEVDFMRKHIKIRDYLKIAEYDRMVFNIYLHIGGENPILCEINQIPLLDKQKEKKARQALKKLCLDSTKRQAKQSLKTNKPKSLNLLISFVIALYNKKVKYNFHISTDHLNEFIIDLHQAIEPQPEVNDFYLDDVYNGRNSDFFTVFLLSELGLQIVNMTKQDSEGRELNKLVLPPAYNKFLIMAIEQLLSILNAT